MINKVNKNEIRLKRHRRVKDSVRGTAARPRLSVYRSLSNIYVQVIDDKAGKTLCSASTIAKGMDVKGKSKVEAAKAVGADIAAKAIKLGIKEVVFDRGGYLYTGRVKAIAESAREAGLKF